MVFQPKIPSTDNSVAPAKDSPPSATNLDHKKTLPKISASLPPPEQGPTTFTSIQTEISLDTAEISLTVLECEAKEHHGSTVPKVAQMEEANSTTSTPSLPLTTLGDVVSSISKSIISQSPFTSEPQQFADFANAPELPSTNETTARRPFITSPSPLIAEHASQSSLSATTVSELFSSLKIQNHQPTTLPSNRVPNVAARVRSAPSGQIPKRRPNSYAAPSQLCETPDWAQPESPSTSYSQGSAVRKKPSFGSTSAKRKLTVPSHLQVSTLVETDGSPPSAGTPGSLESAKAKRKALLRRNTINTSTELRRDDEVEDGEVIRRETFSRKLTKRSKKKMGDDQVVLGTRIGEDHINYVMMYNMLTGIRIGVSRCQAKLQRELTPVDFKAAHKLAFDIMGSELTPSAKYDFKFKDYAPWVFRHLREYFKIDAADYLVSLTSKYILSELGSPGKSGSFFYYSSDYRFIIKTIHHAEHKFFRKILQQYYEHVRNNPNTLISRFFGLHRVKLPRGRKVHFVVMGNVFPPNRDIHETYDLKGSTVGRTVSEEEINTNPRCVMKDLNWVARSRKLEFGPSKRQIFVEQMEKDVALLASLNIMDYSLLVGIHYLERGNKENIRDTTLSVFEPNAEAMDRQPVGSKRGSKVNAMRKVLVQSDPVSLGPSSSKLPDDSEAFSERRHCVFYQDDGGFLATDEDDRPANLLYYIGIIDILTPYNYVKKVEHYWKAMSADKSQISSIDPKHYGKRFLDFMVKTIKSPSPNTNLTAPSVAPSTPNPTTSLPSTPKADVSAGNRVPPGSAPT